MFRAYLERYRLRKYLRSQRTSEALRTHFRSRYAIDVGMYSYGCFDPGRIAKGTTIGRYCSFAPHTHIFNGNHGIDFLSLHPYLYNVALGCVQTETIERSRCVVEDDVWVGHAALILPSVTSIGRGAVIGAGAVVTKDVPRYAIVAGNPARIVRFRFSDEVIEKIERTQWWRCSLDQLKDLIVEQPRLVFGPAAFFADGDDQAISTLFRK